MIYELGERLSVYVYHDGLTRVGTVVKIWLACEERDPAEVCKYHDITPEHRLFKVFCRPVPTDRVVLLKDDGKHFWFSPQSNFQKVTRLLFVHDSDIKRRTERLVELDFSASTAPFPTEVHDTPYHRNDFERLMWRRDDLCRR